MNQDISMRVFHECSGLHAHDYPQILVPIRDSMSIQIGEENFEVLPKELGFIPQGMKHQCNFHGELLAHTDYGVTDIAIMVGYSSNSTFNRAFHSITGMTPKAYRDCACLERIG